MTSGIEQTADATQEISAASEQLAEMAGELEKLVGAFSV